MTIPFEVPTVAIFNHVSLGLPSSTLEGTFQVGERISCTLRIKSILDWGSKAERDFFRDLFGAPEEKESGKAEPKDSMQAMFYEMRFNPNDWAITGKTSSSFTISSMQGVEVEYPLEIIPLRQGNLLLPSVMVYPAASGYQQDHSENLSRNMPSSETYQDDVARCVEVAQPAFNMANAT